ncbi:MAG: type II toxin-antitoxin system Phd/YefM family antitoxin [Spirochaeta sp.]|nr:type II toxin-antitoxin system Phd/YefM family antitoxin [Spirochaeta sp.]
MRRLPLFDVKNRLSALVREAESGSPVELTRHGKPVAVVLGSASYDRLAREQRTFTRLYDRFLQEWPASETEEDGTDPFANLRSRDSGRSVEF